MIAENTLAGQTRGLVLGFWRWTCMIAENTLAGQTRGLVLGFWRWTCMVAENTLAGQTRGLSTGVLEVDLHGSREHISRSD